MNNYTLFRFFVSVKAIILVCHFRSLSLREVYIEMRKTQKLTCCKNNNNNSKKTQKQQVNVYAHDAIMEDRTEEKE